MFDYDSVWKTQVLEPGQTVEIRLSLLKLWIHRGVREWHVAHDQCGEDDSACAQSIHENAFPGEREWIRYIVSADASKVKVFPRMPDRAIIVRPEMRMSLLPGQSVLFFVGIPIWVGIGFAPEFRTAFEVPTMRLSNSWFGPTTEGTLCYAMKTTAKLNLDDLLPHAHRVVFPLEIRNLSTEVLNFERLCLNLESLYVYKGRRRMWANRGRVSFRGEEAWSRVVFGQGAPEFDGAADLLGEAREPGQRGVLMRTFDNIKQWAEH